MTTALRNTKEGGGVKKCPKFCGQADKLNVVSSDLKDNFSPFQRHRKDVSNFDRQFTSEKTDLTPTDKLFMMNLDQNEFAGFSFLNPEFVQHV